MKGGHRRMNYLNNLVHFLVSINANAFWTIVYWLSKNWFIVSSFVFIAILIYVEIKEKESYFIDDQREIY